MAKRTAIKIKRMVMPTKTSTSVKARFFSREALWRGSSIFTKQLKFFATRQEQVERGLKPGVSLDAGPIGDSYPEHL